MKSLTMTLWAGLIIGCCCGTAMAVTCGGTPDCPLAPMPFPSDLPPSSTEMMPGGNWFEAGSSPTNTCYPASGYIAGVNQLRVGRITETQLFNKQPAIEIISAGNVYTYPMSGTALHAGGVLCVPGIGEAVAVTDTTMGTVVGGKLTEHPLPAGSGPVTAAIIGNCMGRSNLVEFCVETTVPTIEVVCAVKQTSFPIPAPLVTNPDSFTNGPISGVAVYTSTTVYVINGGIMNTIPLTTGTYVSHASAANGVNVTTTGGVEFIALAPGCVIVPFAPCLLPLDSCGPDATPSAIAINISPCPDMDAATATWPALGAQCVSTGGLVGGGGLGLAGSGSGSGNTPPPPTIKDKKAGVYAEAFTTLGKPDQDGWYNGTIWTGGSPGISGPNNPLLAYASSFNGGDFSDALAFIEAKYNADKEVLDIITQLDGSIRLIHHEGHVGRFHAVIKDPITFEDWDDCNDVTTQLILREDTLLQISTETHIASSTMIHFAAGSTLPGLTELYAGTLTATHNYVDPNLAVTFESNPLLGLDDDAIKTSLATAFTYDAAEGGYRAPADVNIIEVRIDVPDGVTTFDLSMDLDIEGSHYGPGYFTCDELQAAGGLVRGDVSGPEAVPDCRVDMYDLAAVSGYWLDESCSGPNWCSGTDIDQSGGIDLTDLLAVGEQWLMAAPVFPPHIWFQAWECPTQCSGDADCTLEGNPMMGYYWVGLQDVAILQAAMDTIIGNPNYDPRADFNRDGSVNQDDYNILMTYYMVKNPPQGPGIPDNCAVSPY